MYTIKTRTGRSFDADATVQTENPDRLYVHVLNTTITDVAVAFTTELPIEGYPDYTVFDSMNMTVGGGVNVCLKKGVS